MPRTGATKSRLEPDSISDAHVQKRREMKTARGHAKQGRECPKEGRSNEMGLHRRNEKSAWGDREGSLDGTEPKGHRGQARLL